MQLLTQSSQLFEWIDRIRKGATEFTTDFFAGREQVQAWVERAALSCEEGARCLLILRRDRDFHHIYHVAASLQDLSTALRTLGAQGTALTADLVGLPENTQVVAEVYREHGFRDHTSLVRMVRMDEGSTPGTSEDPPAVFAEAVDLPALCNFLDRVLDRFRDQIPEPEEISAAVARRNILIERRGEALGGVLFFETAGLTSFLRYWYVDRRFHNQGIGGRLIKSYFHICRACRRIVLWVVSDNGDAIDKYRHYGFQKDNLVDRIMICERNS